MHIYDIYACYKNILPFCFSVSRTSATNNWWKSSLLIPLQIEAKSLSNYDYEAELVTQFGENIFLLLLPVLFRFIRLFICYLFPYIHLVFMSLPSRQTASKWKHNSSKLYIICFLRSLMNPDESFSGSLCTNHKHKYQTW